MFLLFTKTVSRPNAEGVEDCSVVSVEFGRGVLQPAFRQELCRTMEVGGRAVGGRTPVALPADRASTRRVVLTREGGRWRVVEARDQASAAASTLRTSSSSKS